MPRVAIKSGHRPATVEGFKAGAERSCPGALHLHPGLFREVTADELEHIEKMELPVDVQRDHAPPAPQAETETAAEADETDEAAAPTPPPAPKSKRKSQPQPE